MMIASDLSKDNTDGFSMFLYYIKDLILALKETENHYKLLLSSIYKYIKTTVKSFFQPLEQSFQKILGWHLLWKRNVTRHYSL